MPKYALCVPVSDLYLMRIDAAKSGVQRFHTPLLNVAHPVLLDRAVCETDEGYRQLIPYIVLHDFNKRLFCYSRGKGSDEERLKAKLSVGLGGHVDSPLPLDVHHPGGLLSFLLSEGQREVQEEAGWVVDILDFPAVILMHDTPVDRVHMGLLNIVPAGAEEDFTLEKGVIEDGQFKSLEELREPATYARLEEWSKAVVDALHSKQIRIA